MSDMLEDDDDGRRPYRAGRRTVFKGESKKVMFALPKKLVDEIDAYCLDTGMTRPGIFKTALAKYCTELGIIGYQTKYDKHRDTGVAPAAPKNTEGRNVYRSPWTNDHGIDGKPNDR